MVGRPLRVTANRDACIGAGQCVLSAPDVFDQEEDTGLVRVRTEQPPAEAHARVRGAAAWCPSGAISLAGGE
jgi:ferredoxin